MSNPVFTIANGETTSNALSLINGQALLSIQLPSAMTGASIALHGSYDDLTWEPIYMDGTAVSVTVVNSSKQSINPRATLGYQSVKLVSGSSETAARTIKACIGKVA